MVSGTGIVAGCHPGGDRDGRQGGEAGGGEPLYSGFPEELRPGFMPRNEVTETDEAVMVKVDLLGVEQEDRSSSPCEDSMFKSGVLTLKLTKTAKAPRSKKIYVTVA